MISYGESYDLFILLIFTNVYTIFENIAKYIQTHREFNKSIRSKFLARQTKEINKLIAELDVENIQNINNQFEEIRKISQNNKSKK